MPSERASRPPLLYLVHRIPYPPNKGDKLRSFNILRQLARRHRVYLGTFVDHPDDLCHVGALSQWCEDVHAVPLNPRRARLASLRGLLTGEALSLPYYRDAGLAAWVRDTVARHRIRDAVAFSGPMAQYLGAAGLRRRIIDFCDVDSAKWTQYAAGRRWPMSWLYRREGARLLAFERRAAADAGASLFVTEAEAELFRRMAPEVSAKVGVMQNGVDAEYFSPRHDFASPFPEGGPVLVFTGAMDYWPNIDAVTWFAADILPAIRARVPGVRFWIVGMNPAPAVQALAGGAKDGDIRVTGTVPDVRPYLAHADVVVAPLRIARGIQNKVLEAMAMGRPVVLSAAPAAGLAAEDGWDCAIAGDAPGFADKVVELLERPGHRRDMGLAGREAVLRGYSWAAHLAQLERLFAMRRADDPPDAAVADGTAIGAPAGAAPR
ncbi:TIGR03087 family PEP-CTERM/XrtA system glycosyltransferase [Thauera sinica]|uniref:TIGR03087 family PEP-CTERM/XrtA system glycosyltransferase n=1 Tax=Thauera sinica TaxID=2665146 RepID=A0ABW1AY11_9RHOO|nr:TIGR03087 family PEP-CTERM/XrtA system glycosyltransferase [Thauera sp. K11]ATE60939.1 sugar transferase [Thauera sp. K11]